MFKLGLLPGVRRQKAGQARESKEGRCGQTDTHFYLSSGEILMVWMSQYDGEEVFQQVTRNSSKYVE